MGHLLVLLTLLGLLWAVLPLPQRVASQPGRTLSSCLVWIKCC